MSDPKAPKNNNDFDLQPDPRVLPMLGEINIDQWRCIAELVDNSIDGFLNAARSGADQMAPRVDVSLPVSDKESAIVKISDNGTGMTPEILERAVRAGWSGNNPIDNLGLFGMGFNIATARLGSVTEVWTTRQGDLEWHGLSIDFDQLRKQRHFRTPHLKRPKSDPQVHGTEVTIKRLKPEQRKWLSKSSNQTTVRKRLAQTYSSMLRKNGKPISFNLFINNKLVEGWHHCTWSEERFVSLAGGGNVYAVTPINFTQAERLYCNHCMSWLTDANVNENCPICDSSGTVNKRARRITGWIGIQRYLDQTDYGFDFIRNGRKIEIANKDLFFWRDGESEEREYPVDDQRGRGRIVGEIHIDHCRVSYAKDRFDRADPSWEEMIELLRGEGPLRPEKAKSLGFTNNQSLCFFCSRHSAEQVLTVKRAGAYARIMIVKDNARALEMATSFHEGHPEYQDDAKWWELVEEADRELLYGPRKPKPSPGDQSDDADKLPGGILDGEEGESAPPQNDTAGDTVTKPPQRREISNLSRKYVYRDENVTWNVQAFEVEPADPDLPEHSAWTITLADIATRTYHFLYEPTHSIFRSVTMTPRDALLTQLSWMTCDILRTSSKSPDLSRVLASFRSDYGEENLLEPRALSTDAAELLSDIAKAFANNCPEESRSDLFNELTVTDQQSVMRALATRKVKPSDVTTDGSFLIYSPYEIIRTLVSRHPEYCFDGQIWDEPYEGLDYGSPEITTDARKAVMTRFLGLLSDAIWLTRQDNDAFAKDTRQELIRASMSLHLLRPDVDRQ
jgi:hypothetical protein